MALRPGEITTRRSLEGLRLFLARQRWEQPQVHDLPRAVAEALASAGLRERLRPGDEVAITAGSRGIAAMPIVLRAVVDVVRAWGGAPFILPAMGSHGGGTAEGQKMLLAELGITEKSVGAPIRATMEVVRLGETAQGLPVHLDAIAARAAGIILVNRIKKHTNFDGPVESGLCKMAVIGLGKHTQAALVHSYGNASMAAHILAAAEVVLARAKIWAGLALVENAWGGVAELAGLQPEEIIPREPELLRRAKALSAKIPFQHLDIALVERMGKEISGTGMDCYVIGRKRIIGEAEWPEAPHIRSLVVLDLTEASQGNAVGVGLADFTTQRLAAKIDWPTTLTNILTSGNLERGKLPPALATDREALEAAAFRERTIPLEKLRFVALRDTLHLRYLVVSEALREEAGAALEILGGPLAPPFDGAGNWLSPLPPEDDPGWRAPTPQ